MNLRRIIFAATLLTAAPAEAATYIITYSGTVSSGSVRVGNLGEPGIDLSGLSFTAVFRLTAPLPGAFTFDNGVESQILGGIDSGYPVPMTSKLIIDDMSLDMQNIASSFVHYADGYGVPSYGYDSMTHYVLDWYPPPGSTHRFYMFSMGIRSAANNFLSSRDYTAPLTYTVQPGDEAFGGGEFIDDLLSENPRAVVVDLRPTRVTVERAVPEPATWAMMIAGFGIVGASMRRRQKLTVRYA